MFSVECKVKPAQLLLNLHNLRQHGADVTREIVGHFQPSDVTSLANSASQSMKSKFSRLPPISPKKLGSLFHEKLWLQKFTSDTLS